MDAPGMTRRESEQIRHFAARQLPAIEHRFKDASRLRRQRIHSRLFFRPEQNARAQPVWLNKRFHEQAYFDARSFGWSRRPIIELVIPSTIDGTLAPHGQHVASLFCQHVAPKLSDGSSWDDHRETVAIS
jgi:phytoene dehydrogenase-like protein